MPFQDIITTVQLGWIGVWGEWYFTDNYGNHCNRSEFNCDLFPDTACYRPDLWELRREVWSATLRALPDTMSVQVKS